MRGRADSFEYDVVHEREIRLIGGNRLVVLDDLRSDSYHSYEQVFQLTPAAHHRVTQHGGTVTAPHMRISQHGAGTNCSIADGWVSPSYGVKVGAPVVRYRLSGTNVRFETHLELHQ